MNFNSKNPFDLMTASTVNQTTQDDDLKRLQGKFQHQTHYDRTANEALIYKYLIPLAAILSIFTASIWFYDWLSHSIGLIPAYIVTATLLVIIELLKHIYQYRFFNTYFQYSYMNKSVLIALMLFSLISLYSSGCGSAKIPIQYGHKAELLNLDSITAHHDKLIAYQDSTIAVKQSEALRYEEKNTTSNNQVRYKAIASVAAKYELVKDTEKAKAILQQDKKVALDKAEKVNQDRSKMSLQKLANYGNYMILLTLVSELGQLLMRQFLVKRDYLEAVRLGFIKNEQIEVSNKEASKAKKTTIVLKEHQDEQIKQAPTPLTTSKNKPLEIEQNPHHNVGKVIMETPSSSNDIPQRNPIGFLQKIGSGETMQDRIPIQEKTTVKAVESVTTPVETVITLVEKPVETVTTVQKGEAEGKTIEHNGKFYVISQVLGMQMTARKRALTAGDADAIENSKAWVCYWNERMRGFKLSILQGALKRTITLFIKAVGQLEEEIQRARTVSNGTDKTTIIQSLDLLNQMRAIESVKK